MRTTELQHPGAEGNSISKPQTINSLRPLRLKLGASVGTWCLALLASSVRGQDALDAFNPNADNLVTVVVVQPDGKVLLGGNFTTLSPNGGAAVTRNRIARLNPDGRLDTAFNPNANGQVNAIAVQADGRILVGGFFNGTNSIGGRARNYIARLDATTGAADSTFDPNANQVVESIAVQADGKVLVCGYFAGANSIGGQTRNYIARLNPTNGLADSFNPNANGPVNAMMLQPDGKILAGGSFSGANSIGGQTRNRIARLDPATGLADAFDPNANNSVISIVVQTDGMILAGGAFTNIAGQARNHIARLDPVRGLADSFDPNAQDNVESIAVQADGKVLAGGSFFGANSIGGQMRNHIARLESDGSLDRTLNLNAIGGFLYATAIQPDGKILIGGGFTNVLGVTRSNIARLNVNGTLDTVFNPNANDSVFSIAVQPDGKVLAGGYFTHIGGQTRNRIARLDPAAGLADSFNPNANDAIWSIALQADGKILAGGWFQGTNSIGGQTRNYIGRLDPSTGLADSFNPNADFGVFTIAVQADGKILTGGRFFTIGGQTRSEIARLDPTTGLADSFDPGTDSEVNSITVQADGKILVGGSFDSIGGQFRYRIARLDPTTGLADSFNPSANSDVNSIAVQADGKILVGGYFTAIGGQTRNRIARLDPATGLADSFDPDASGGDVSAIAIQADGKILVGGSFTNIGGLARNLFARLSEDTAALQNLAVTQTTATWTLGGSGPQFRRVTFELSTDNVNYTPLGNGTAVGSNWTLTGLSLSTGQNLYIRARGYYPGGLGGGSQSLTESVRNAFIVARPLLSIYRSANTNVVLSWATNSTGFTLEANTNLNTNIWSVVSPAPVVSGTNNVVTNAVSGSARFYRLRQ